MKAATTPAAATLVIPPCVGAAKLPDAPAEPEAVALPLPPEPPAEAPPEALAPLALEVVLEETVDWTVAATEVTEETTVVGEATTAVLVDERVEGAFF